MNKYFTLLLSLILPTIMTAMDVTDSPAQQLLICHMQRPMPAPPPVVASASSTQALNVDQMRALLAGVGQPVASMATGQVQQPPSDNMQVPSSRVVEAPWESCSGLLGAQKRAFLLTQAIDATTQGDFLTAFDNSHELIDAGLALYKFYVFLGNLHYLAGDLTGACDFFSRAEPDPSCDSNIHAFAQKMLAEIQFKINHLNSEQTINSDELFRRALQAKREDNNELAFFYFQRLAERLKPRSPDAEVVWECIHAMKPKQSQPAHLSFWNLIDRQPSWKDLYCVALAAQREGQEEAAFFIFREMISSNEPYTVYAHAAWANIHAMSV